MYIYIIFQSKKLKRSHNSQNTRNQDFSYFFFWIEGSGSGSIPLTNGSGSGSRRPKNKRIRNVTQSYKNIYRCGEQQRYIISSVGDPLHSVRIRIRTLTDGSRSVPLANGSGWPKNMRILLDRIPNNNYNIH
jgi:hypothetical protein